MYNRYIRDPRKEGKGYCSFKSNLLNDCKIACIVYNKDDF